MFFQSQNNLNELNNQFSDPVDYFPGNNNKRINIVFENSKSKNKFNIASPVNIKVKDLFIAYAKEMGISPNILGKQVFFLFNDNKIKINEEKDLISYGLDNCNKILVLDTQIVIFVVLFE